MTGTGCVWGRPVFGVGVLVRWRWVAGLALAAALLAVGCLGDGREPVARVASGVAPSATRDGGLGLFSRLPVGAQSVISATVSAHDPRFLPRPRARGFALDGGGVGAVFARGGVGVAGGGGRLSLRVVGVGRGSRLRALAGVAPGVSAHRVVYAPGGGVREWYQAGPLGIEQGFRLARRPAGGSGAVTLAVSVAGLRARRSGSGVVFLAGSRRVALRYGGLVAFDARRRRLAAWVSLSGSRLLLRVADRGAAYPLRVDPLIQQGPKLVGTGATGGAEQGYSVALSADGNTALIGGPWDNSFAGAAWVFVRSGGTWAQQGSKLMGTGAIGIAEQGYSVALSADGNTALIGGDGDNGFAGAAWVFVRSDGAWSQQGSKLVGSGATGAAFQGASVALSADGNTALIGGPYDNGFTGAAWVFVRSQSGWSQQGPKLVGTGAVGAAEQGYSVALSADGNTALIGGPYDNSFAGAAWVFVRSGGTWAQQGSKLMGTGAIGIAEQGYSVALSKGGNTALIGGSADNGSVGAAWVFVRSQSGWSQQGSKLVGAGATGAAGQGTSVALSADGNTALIGGSGDDVLAGAAWVFVRSQSGWSQQGSKLVGTGAAGIAGQGVSVALSADGNTALIGGLFDDGNVGAAWVFVYGVAPAITSAPGATFTVGRAGSFTVTSTGLPTASLSESSALPAGVGFTDNGNGTGTLSGIPAAGTGGVYRLTLRASNGVSPDATQSFVLLVQAPPSVVISTPARGGRYTRNQRVLARYSCSEGASGPGLSSCAGTVKSGAAINTSKTGRYTFTVTATSFDGLSTTSTVTYTVVLPNNRFSVSRIKTFKSGTLTFTVKVPGPGRIDVLETAWNDNFARAAILLLPAAQRFVYSRALTFPRKAGTLQLTVTPNARGRRLVANPRYRVTLRLWVSYTPTGGVHRSIGFYGLRLPK